jgi:hypothetical protein
MVTKYREIKKAIVGQKVYVTVSGREYFEGVVVDYGCFSFYPNQQSYQVMVYRDGKPCFTDCFDKVYELLE